MLAGVVVIGVLGLALEKLVFQRLEDTPYALGDDDMTLASTASALRSATRRERSSCGAVYEAVARTGFSRRC